MSTQKRRSAGDGCVYYDVTNERWVGYVQRDGRRISVRGKTAKEAADKLRVKRTRLGEIPGSMLTCTEWFETWLLEAERDRVYAGGTADNYRGRLKHYIIPAIGDTRLSQLTAQHLRNMLGEAEKNGASANVRASLRSIVKAGLGEAYLRELVPGNVADKVRSPKPIRGRRRSIGDVESVLAFIAAARGDRNEALYLLKLGNGLRFSEIAGLQPEDIDVRRGLLHVRRQLYERSGGKLELKPPKGGKEVTLPLVPLCVEALERHLAARQARPPSVPYLFTSEKGQGLRRSRFHRDMWHPFREAHDLPYMVPHQLRHTTGTLLKLLGAPIEVVKEILRHASVVTTDEFYQDELPHLQVKALADLSKLLGGAYQKRTASPKVSKVSTMGKATTRKPSRRAEPS